MLHYTLKRLLLAVPTFIGITVVTFAVIHIAPGDPAASHLDDGHSPDAHNASYERLQRHFGLDRPLHIQYARWISRVATLDFGHSFSDHRPVWDKVRERLPWTLAVAILSLMLGFALAVPIGVWSAGRTGGWGDTVVSTALYALYSIPNYVMAMILIALVVTLPIDWLPVRNAYSDSFGQMSNGAKLVDLLKHLLLITLCYTYPALAYQTRFVRANLLEVLQQDYIRTAHAKGLSPTRVLMRHAFRNTFVPLLTYVGLLLPTVIGGSAILEVMFNWPGIGRLFYNAILQRDYPTVMALSVITAVLVQLGTLLADLGYAWADPRIRYDTETAPTHA